MLNPPRPAENQGPSLTALTSELLALSGPEHYERRVDLRIAIMDKLLGAEVGFERSICDLAQLVGIPNNSDSVSSADVMDIFGYVLTDPKCPAEVAQCIDAVLKGLPNTEEARFRASDRQELLLQVPRSQEVTEHRILLALGDQNPDVRSAGAQQAAEVIDRILRGGGEDIRGRVITFLLPMTPHLLREIYDTTHSQTLPGVVLPTSASQHAINCFSSISKQCPDVVLDLLTSTFQPALKLTEEGPIQRSDTTLPAADYPTRIPVVENDKLTREGEGALILITQILKGQFGPEVMSNAVRNRLRTQTDETCTEFSYLMRLALRSLE